ncbi:PH-domain-containing protein [Dacryopinax primogenitus]|uniref:PH-domain-containing protein n=1 Tax=Dacryopinax primogenitus (strain DJM 731) TaxID=1858805 RepID=M5GE48_DACPD|nr:PH-domain-containing protein [Dacryopinax primogenitus]EJU05077.1 PH-domain-containing protein [Dacryopinax primogenitus]
MSTQTASSHAVSAAAPPSPQEVHRKLSMTAPGPMPVPSRTPSKRTVRALSAISTGAPVYPSAFSSESDSDTSAMHSPTAAHHTIPSFSEGGSTLGVIEERATQDGSESDEDEEVEASEGEVDEGGLRDEQVIKAGYLLKKGERRKAWQKRWFVLRGAKLAYYKSDAEYRLLQLIPTSSISAVQPVTLKKYGHAFALITASRTYYLRAETEREAQDWVAALREIARDAKEEEAEELESAMNVASPASVTNQLSAPLPPRISLSTKHTSPILGTSSDSDEHRSPQSPPGRSRSSSTAMATSLPTVPPSPVAPTPASAPSTGMLRSVSTKRDPNKPILQGYMTKMGKRKQWRKRWFVLKESGLEYGKSHMDTRSHRSIPISQILHAVEYAPPDPKSHHHLPHLPHSPPEKSIIDTSGLGPEEAHIFKVITPERAYILCAPSEDEEIKWLSALRALIERTRGAGGV